MKDGVIDYMVKFFVLEVLLNMVSCYVLVKLDDNGDVVVVDMKSFKLFVLVDKVVKIDVNVMILGLSGLGKEVMLCYIYNVFFCKEGLFIVINCVVIFDNMLEVILFGYEKGVFIGVV